MCNVIFNYIFFCKWFWSKDSYNYILLTRILRVRVMADDLMSILAMNKNKVFNGKRVPLVNHYF